MIATSAITAANTPTIPFAPGFAASSFSGFAEASAPRLIRSVVDQAGLGRFVYLQGDSGRRYVFSSIKREQAALYDHAVFASAEAGGGTVKVGRSIGELGSGVALLYVHLLDDAIECVDATLSDLGGQCAA